MDIENVNVNELIEPKWNATHILRPDLLVLASSIGQHGILSPLIVQKSGRLVIDGTQRLRLIMGNKHLLDLTGGIVPVTWVDVDELEAMIMHVQLNRGHGTMVAKKLSGIVRTLSMTQKFSEEDFVTHFAMKPLELELMLDATILKHRNIKNHTYSRAWVPVEAPPGTIDNAGSIVIEAPPNSDR
jgi:hypothetical protein